MREGKADNLIIDREQIPSNLFKSLERIKDKVNMITLGKEEYARITDIVDKNFEDLLS